MTKKSQKRSKRNNLPHRLKERKLKRVISRNSNPKRATNLKSLRSLRNQVPRRKVQHQRRPKKLMSQLLRILRRFLVEIHSLTPRSKIMLTKLRKMIKSNRRLTLKLRLRKRKMKRSCSLKRNKPPLRKQKTKWRLTKKLQLKMTRKNLRARMSDSNPQFYHMYVCSFISIS